MFATVLLWEGGVETIREISIDAQMSLVACQGTGGLADLFAKAVPYSKANLAK